MDAQLSALEGYICGGFAACTAVTFSNPAEVAKTRMQLQGELVKSGGPKVYKNVADVLIKTWRNEGIRGVQRGLGPAYFYQWALNGTRLGLYEPLRRWSNVQLGYSPTQQVIFTSMGAGSASSVVGAFLGNPIFLVKCRRQAYSPALPVGTQRYYRHAWDAFSTIVREEGPKGLMRGWDASVFRATIGGAIQLPAYIWSKNQMVHRGFGHPDSTWTFLMSSSIASVILCLLMQPADTTLTRMCNQPTVKGPNGRTVGVLYSNPIDCLWKTLRAEGISGWYKGTTAHFLRIAPHTIITLTANDIIVRFYLRARRRRESESP